MDFDSPDVMKDFPGLYASELKKKCNNGDYSDENEKVTTKDMLIGKRKEKKDKKDKEKGYAALEGESSEEESHQKSKLKSKSFKFTKSKEKDKDKREKHRDKDNADKKKGPKKSDKKTEKEKTKKGHKFKHSLEETIHIADALPIFGVSLDLAVERSRCHDGINIPLPIRECIDYVEAGGLTFEGVYKISGTKTKVSQLRKMYNHRQQVKLSDYDVPTATSLLKMFLRDLPEPIFTNELIIRFEEAGAILNLQTREKHLKNLVDTLPPLNKLLLSWLIIHLHNVTLKEHMNKMSKQNIAAALNHTFHVSSRLLQALLHHSRALFPDVVVYKYIPPLGSGAQLPEKPQIMEVELKKQESLLNQIHQEMNVGCISKQREELLWEVQRIITQLKRKLKKVQKPAVVRFEEKQSDESQPIDDVKKETSATEESFQPQPSTSEASVYIPTTSGVRNVQIESSIKQNDIKPESNGDLEKNVATVLQIAETDEICENQDEESWDSDSDASSATSGFLAECLHFDDSLVKLKVKNEFLRKVQELIVQEIAKENMEIDDLKQKISTKNTSIKERFRIPKNYDEIRNLLVKENQILELKKINLVRQINEQIELCAELCWQLNQYENNCKLKLFSNS